jgi:hypothetical protein
MCHDQARTAEEFSIVRRLPSLLAALALVACGGGGGGGSSSTGLVSNCSENVRLSFQPVDNAALDTEYFSNVATAGRLCAVRDIFFYSNGTAAYSIDQGPWLTSRSTIRPGQSVQVRMVSAPTYGATRLTSLTIGEETCGLDIFGNRVCRLEGETGQFVITTPAGSAAEAPEVAVTYPADGESVNAISLTVTGTATDPDGVAEVLVNGIRATSQDGFASWEATVPLTTGQNQLMVDAADNLLNRRTAAVTLTISNTRIVFQNVRAIDMASQGALLYVIDLSAGGLVAVDPMTDAWTLASSDGGSPLPFLDPRSLFVDEAAQRAWVVDYGYSELLAIDLVDGSRHLLTGNGEALENARDVVLDESRNRLLVLEQLRGPTTSSTFGSARVMSLNLTTGERQLLSDNERPPGEPEFWYAISTEFDAAGDRLIVVDTERVLTIDPVTGERSTLWSPTFEEPLASELDPVGGRLILAVSQAILEVDLATGMSSLLIDAGGTGNLEYDQRQNRIFFGRRYLMAIDLTTQETFRLY